MIVTRTKKIGEIIVTQSFEISVEEINNLKVDLDKILESVFKDFTDKIGITDKMERGPEAIVPLNRTREILVGEASSEIIMPLQRTEDSKKPAHKIDINISPFKPSENIDLYMDLIKRAVAEDLAKGGTTLNRSFEGRYGANPATGNKR